MLSRVFPAVLLLAVPAVAQDMPKAELKPNVRVAIIGDSITEQKLYSKYVADYLYACQPQLNPHVVQFGWGGERATGFAARLENDLMPFKPDVVTTCYGMNDGSYTKYTDQIGAAYEKPMRSALPNKYRPWLRPAQNWCASRSTAKTPRARWGVSAVCSMRWAVAYHWSATSITTAICC